MLIAVVSCITVFAFAGCQSAGVKKTQIDDKPCYVFTAELGKEETDVTVADYLLKLKDKGELDFEGSTSDYGLYITSVDGLKEQYSADFSSGYYWSLYLDFTTLDGDAAVYADEDNICEYEDVTYYYASYGFSGIPCIDGHTYILAYVSYGG